MSNQESQVRVVAICGSLHPESKTKMALNIALRGALDTGADVQLIDLNNYDLVFCDGISEEGHYPDDVYRLRQDVERAQGIILGTPEYHSGYSGVLKNALDLMGFQQFQGKVIGLVGVAGGSTGAINSLNGLRNVGRSLRAWVVPNQVSIPQAWRLFDKAGQMKDSGLEERLVELGREVARFAYLHTSQHTTQFLKDWEVAKRNPGGE